MSENDYNSDESIGSCEGNPPFTDPANYFKNLGLEYFLEAPLDMLYRHSQLKNECLAYDNPKAHYIEGLLQYFQCRKSIKGLTHLRRSADGGYDNGIYICGILMLCRGDFAEGKEYIDKLSWKTNQDRSPQCLTTVKTSLRSIKVILKTRYLANTARMEPVTECHQHDMDSACEDCYYFKKMNEFIDYIRTKNP